MMGMRGIKKSVVCMALMVLMCVALMATASATTVDFGKRIQVFNQNGTASQVLGTSGNTDTVKTVSPYAFPEFYTIIKPPSSTRYIYQTSSYSLPSYNAYRITAPVYYPTITPVPQQGAGSSGSTLGGLIILGANEGDTIYIKSNFYNSTKSIYNGRWQIAGYTPAYWEDQVLPGSYSIKIAHGGGNYGRNYNPSPAEPLVYSSSQVGQIYYCETVTVVAGQTTVVDGDTGGLCAFGSCCC